MANTVAIFKIALKNDPQNRNLKNLNLLMDKIAEKTFKILIKHLQVVCRKEGKNQDE